MTQFMQSLPDGWTIYLWLVAAAAMIIAAIFFIRWAYRHGQFDEDIKYLVFDEKDRDKMTPEDFAKMQAVKKDQIQKREAELKAIAEQRAARHAKR